MSLLLLCLTSVGINQPDVFTFSALNFTTSKSPANLSIGSDFWGMQPWPDKSGYDYAIVHDHICARRTVPRFRYLLSPPVQIVWTDLNIDVVVQTCRFRTGRWDTWSDGV